MTIPAIGSKLRRPALRRLVIGAGAASWCLWPAAAAALPSYAVLSCQSACAKWQPAERIGGADFEYPRDELDRSRQEAYVSSGFDIHSIPPDASDAFVSVRFAIDDKGDVKDAEIEEAIGPKSFQDSALETVSKWKYRPATADGKPAATYNHVTGVIYRIGEETNGARNAVADVYDKARALSLAGDFAGANAMLDKLAALPRFTFYERSMISLAMAANHWQLHEYDQALERIRDATFYEGTYLDRRSRADAVRLRIEFAAHAGQFVEALVWFGHLKELMTVAPDDPVQVLVDKIEKRLADPAPLRTAGLIPGDGRTAVWSRVLLRRTFAFTDIDGKLDTFRLRCDEQEIQSAVSDQAEWKVPKSWSNCTLDVKGAPGARFVLAEVDG